MFQHTSSEWDKWISTVRQKVFIRHTNMNDLRPATALADNDGSEPRHEGSRMAQSEGTGAGLSWHQCCSCRVYEVLERTAEIWSLK